MSSTSATLALAVPVALAIDRLCGGPPAWAHPVVAMGAYLRALGPRLAALSPAWAWIGGTLAWCVAVAALAALGAWLEAALLAAPAWAAALVLGVLLKPLLSVRCLLDEVAAVEAALAGSLEQGRVRLARLVSRDTTALSETAIREAALETLSENLNDSVVAPLFWWALAGLPGALVYRFANTADAMWGYRGRYAWAGWCAARADDVLSWWPARITAMLLCLAAGRWPGWGALRREAAATPSPNGGWPMGAMAPLSGCALGKPGAYALNAARSVTEQSDRRPGPARLGPEVTLRLRRPPWLLEDLNHRLVGVDEVRLEQVIAQQVDDRLDRLADPDHARRQGGPRQIAAEAALQCGLPIQRQRIEVLRAHHPGEGRFGQQPLRDDARRGRGDLDPLVAARAGVLHPLVLDHPHLLGNDVELLADLDTDLDQDGAVVRAAALGFGQFVANDLARQIRIQGLASALLAHVAGHLDAARLDLFGGRRALGCQGFGLFEEEVLLVTAVARFASGGEQLPQVRGESLLEQIALDRDGPQLIPEGVPLGDERGEGFGGQGCRSHRPI